MAVVNSAGGGVARKSADNKTYRMVRGRIIMSRKRGSSATGATTRGMSGNIRKPLFAMINTYMSAHQTDIQVSFNKSKYGSQRNYFFSTNYNALFRALKDLALAAAASGVLPTEVQIETAVTAYATTNPTDIYRVKLAGFEPVYLKGAWSSEDNPISGGAVDGLGSGSAVVSTNGYKYTAPTQLSIGRHSGARIVHAAGKVTLSAGAIPAGLTASSIVYWTASGIVSPAISVSGVVSNAGSVSYTTPEFTESQNIVAVQLGNIYLRLSSAYVKTADGDPLG